MPGWAKGPFRMICMHPRAFALTTLLASTLTCVAGAAEGVGTPAVSAEVGRLHRAWIDPARTNWRGDGPRPLAATVWYPATPGPPAVDWRAGVFHFGRTALDAPFSDATRRPLIVLSHGIGGSAGQLSWLAETLVHRGYVVAAVNHHGNTSAEEAQAIPAFVLPAERGRDLSLLIDHLLDDKALGQRIDVGRIGAAGFSSGGLAALSLAGAHLSFEQMQRQCRESPDASACKLPPEATFSESDVLDGAKADAVFATAIKRSQRPVTDARVRAVYAIAPTRIPLIPADSWRAVVTPVRVVLAEKDQQVPWPATEKLIRQVLPAAEVVRVPDAGHNVFLAVCSLRGLLRFGTLCRDPDVTDRAMVHERIGLDAARFFDSHLVGGEGR